MIAKSADKRVDTMPKKKSDPFEEIQNKIYSLEKEVSAQKAKAAMYRKQRDEAKLEYDLLKRRFETASVNQSEIEQLQIENGRLLVQINQMKRESESSKMIEKIRKIVMNGE